LQQRIGGVWKASAECGVNALDVGAHDRRDGSPLQRRQQVSPQARLVGFPVEAFDLCVLLNEGAGEFGKGPGAGAGRDWSERGNGPARHGR
jgi:hypothetical protein